MGMTIEDAILYMELYKRKLFDSVSDLDKDIEAYDMAIDTMRKYQKIQEILNSASYTENGTVYSYIYDEDTRVKNIREVIKDGNVD